MSQNRFKFGIFKTFIPVLFYYIPKSEWFIHHPEKYSDEDCFKLAKKIINLERKAAWTETIYTGTENLPEKNGFIMCPNHQGKYDALGILLQLQRPCSVLWAKQTSGYLLASQVNRLLRCELIDLLSPSTFLKSIKNLAEQVKKGTPYIVFPEGKYDHNKNTLQEFQSGCFMAAYLSKAPIVPVALYDSYKAMDEDNLFTKAVTQVHFLKPITYENYKDLNRKELSSLVKSRIQEKLTEIEKQKEAI